MRFLLAAADYEQATAIADTLGFVLRDVREHDQPLTRGAIRRHRTGRQCDGPRDLAASSSRMLRSFLAFLSAAGLSAAGGGAFLVGSDIVHSLKLSPGPLCAGPTLE